MIEIRPIKPDEWNLAKQVIFRVAHVVFNDPLPLEKSIAIREAQGKLQDMNDIQGSYFENGGIFLVLTDGNEILGTGAIRRMEDDTCELKRLWLLTEYQGRGFGYRMVQELLAFAREKGYRRIRLETDPVYQKRAVEFYKRLGFYKIPLPEATDGEDILMEMVL